MTEPNKPSTLNRYSERRPMKTLSLLTATALYAMQRKDIRQTLEEDILNAFTNGGHQPQRPEPGTVILDDRRPTPRNRKERRAAKHRRQP